MGTTALRSLEAAYQNPVLKVLLFSSSAGVAISSSQDLTVSDDHNRLGTAKNLLVTPASQSRLLINQKLTVTGNLLITARGETTIQDMNTRQRRKYLGTFEIRPYAGGLHLINHIPTESYLEGVLNAEISTKWHMEVVKAQAVISRTFALFKREKYSQLPWHLTAGHYDQVYKGSDIADERGKAAIQATQGIVVGYGGHLAQTFYHSNCGGITEDPVRIWQNPLPYLKVKPVPYGERDPRYHWEARITDWEMEKILNKARIRTSGIEDIIISKRTSSSRVLELTFIGERNSTLSGYDFRKAGGYKRIQSLLFDITRIPGGFHFKGRGNGHGVGLSQWSAKEMAEKGYKYHEILYYFYHNIELIRHQG
ncbi:MAG: SpoIID/LytB domain-containing protein [bacterium]